MGARPEGTPDVALNPKTWAWCPCFYPRCGTQNKVPRLDDITSASEEKWLSLLHQDKNEENAHVVLSVNAHNKSPIMAGARCSYTCCLGVYPPNLLEVCQTTRCKKKVHHLCQIEFKHRQNIDAGLSKKCMRCLTMIVEKQNSSTTDKGTSTTAVHHTVRVNVHMHTSPANPNADPKSSANTSKQTSGKSSTSYMNNLSKGVSFADKKTKKSSIESYKLSLHAQKGFSKCICIFPPHILLCDQLCVGKGVEVAEGFSEDAGPYACGKITSVPSKKKGIDFYTIKYDNTYKKMSIYLTQALAIHKMNSFLKRAIARADEKGYRYSKGVKKKKKKRRKEQKNRRKETRLRVLEASKKHNTDDMSSLKGNDGGSSLLYSDDDTEYTEDMMK
eukprot:15366985-Ditylum_brightwellii.AAC.1